MNTICFHCKKKIEFRRVDVRPQKAIVSYVDNTGVGYYLGDVVSTRDMPMKYHFRTEWAKGLV